MEQKIKWGIIGLGRIAHTFAEDLELAQHSTLHGVASRNDDKAKEFAAQYGAPLHFGSYEALAGNPEIDVVYIATPHPLHLENTLMCLENGKHVLCEKPMGMDLSEVQSMIREAQDRKLFLMEAMWTRFIPAIEKLTTLLDQKVIGELLSLRVDFGFKADFDPTGRLFNKKLGGGSLLDIGIYPIFLSHLVLGMPARIQATARMSTTGVDSHCAMLFDYAQGAKANLESTFEANTPVEAYIYGAEGYIKLHSHFYHTKKITLARYGHKDEVFEIDYKGNGYTYEIEEVERCLAENRQESAKLPLETSLQIMEIIDRVKEKIGLSYQ